MSKTQIRLPSIYYAGRMYKVELGVELNSKGVFTASADVYRKFWKCGETQEDWIMCGQCLDSLAEYKQIKNDSRFQKVYEWWKKWHLNDLHSGTEKQEEALEKAGLNNWASEYSECCDYLKSIDLLIDKGYKFGTGWLKREIPNEIQQEMLTFIKENSNAK